MTPCEKSCGSFGSAGHRCAQCYRHHHLSAGAGGVAPCVKSCGSFGSAAINYLCAQCYRDHLNAADRAAEAARMQALLVRLGVEAAAVADVAAVPKTAGANRCAACRKKVGLLGFTCHCGGEFCSVHRHAEAHACGFDYKKGRKRIAVQNPVVVASKVTDGWRSRSAHGGRTCKKCSTSQ